MKKSAVIIVFLFIMGASRVEAHFGGAYVYFYSELKPYGEWIELERDFVVWRPLSVGFGWHPYTVGRWEYTRYGWYWISYEPFGWATFHYGRWFYDDYYGWLWLPGYEWSPAWVEWRYNSHYIGWAPIPPVHRRLNIKYRYYGTKYRTNYHSWRYVDYRNFHEPRNKYLPQSRNEEIYERTSGVSNYSNYEGRRINRGIDRGIIEKYSGRTINEREVNMINNKGVYDDSKKNNRKDLSTFIIDKKEVDKVRSMDTEKLRFEIKHDNFREKAVENIIPGKKNNIADERVKLNNQSKNPSPQNMKQNTRSIDPAKGMNSKREVRKDQKRKEEPASISRIRK